MNFCGSQTAGIWAFRDTFYVYSSPVPLYILAVLYIETNDFLEITLPVVYDGLLLLTIMRPVLRLP